MSQPLVALNMQEPTNGRSRMQGVVGLGPSWLLRNLSNIFKAKKEQYISRVNLNDAADDDDESTSAEQS